MLESLLFKTNKKIAGMGEVLFHGLVSSSEVITGDNLANTIGLGAVAIAENNLEPWLSFSIDNKRLFVAKKAYRHSVMWNNLYHLGAVYGRDDTGPGGVSYQSLTPTVQNRKITIGGKQYRVRLLKGNPVNPAPNTTGTQLAQTKDSEWDRLIYSIAQGRPGPADYQGPIFANFTDAELGIVNKDAGEGPGGLTWCQEHHLSAVTNRVCRGFYDPTFIYREDIALNNPGWGWRPVLEAI
jgi:hypothetical protein